MFILHIVSSTAQILNDFGGVDSDINETTQEVKRPQVEEDGRRCFEERKGALKEAIKEKGRDYPEFNAEFWLLIEERVSKERWKRRREDTRRDSKENTIQEWQPRKNLNSQLPSLQIQTSKKSQAWENRRINTCRSF